MSAVDAVDASLALSNHVLRQGDRALVLAQRLLQEITHAPEIEEDMALANVALDLIGQARHLYTYAGEIEGVGHDEDHFAYWRDAAEFRSPVLVERPNVDFAHVIVRQYLHDQYAIAYWQAMTRSTDATLAAIAGKAVKETTYHLRHSRGWVVRLGDGTQESHDRAQSALDQLLPFASELFACGSGDELLATTGVAPLASELEPGWTLAVEATCDEAALGFDRARLTLPARRGDELVALVGEMQVLARAHPGATW